MVRIIKPPKLWENFRSFTLFLYLSLSLTHTHTLVSTTDKCLLENNSFCLAGFLLYVVFVSVFKELTNYRRS